MQVGVSYPMRSGADRKVYEKHTATLQGLVADS
jgi:hypothetical protein